jgi:two-component system sensor histidine kinase KdpD
VCRYEESIRIHHESTVRPRLIPAYTSMEISGYDEGMSLATRHDQAAVRRRSRYLRRVTLAVLGVLLACTSSLVAFWLHFSFATVISLQLLLVVVIALRGSFVLATAVSLAGFFCLNFLFVQPLFRFTVTDPRDWVSLISFELTALLVSGLSTKVREHAAEADRQRDRSLKLYELSRAILLIDGRRSVCEQLAPLIRNIIQVGDVDLWLLHEDPLGSPRAKAMGDPESAASAYQSGRSEDDESLGFSSRLLRIGTSVIGAIALKGWSTDALMADGVASLSAVAVERARAVQKETRAESERDTETLRTAVLDGLAHGFKTPLTAIQAASSGLLALNHMNPTQMELVTIIDDQASMLNTLATRLLQTAALDRKAVKLHRSEVLLASLIHQVVAEQDAVARNRIEVQEQDAPVMVWLDAPLVEQAIIQLLDNAMKYADPETPIRVVTTQREVVCCVMVESHGPPIKLTERERLFERFYRGNAESRHRQPGTGLGLSVVSKTAVAHGGRAWVDCENGLNKFFFTLEGTR